MNSKYLFVILTLSITVFSFIACNSSHEPSSQIIREGYTVEIYDSIVMPKLISGLCVTDIKDGILLGFSFYTNELYLVNIADKSIQSYNFSGEGPGEYGQIKGLSYLGENILLLTDNKYILYNSSGEFLQEYLISHHDGLIGWNLNFNIPTLFNQNDTILINRKYIPEIHKFRENLKLFSFYSRATKKFRYKIGLEQESIYLSKMEDEFIEMVPAYSQNEDQTQLCVLYPLESKIYNYHVSDSITLSSVTNFNAENFGEIYTYPSEKSSEQINKLSFKYEQMSSTYKNIRAIDGVKLIYYETGLDNNQIAKTRKEYDEKEMYKDKASFALIVFGDNDNSNPISLKDEYNNRLWLACAESLSTVIFKKFDPKGLKEEPAEVLKIGRLVKPSR